MASILIKDTTREERERIVADSLGAMDASCDGCSAGMYEMYQDYMKENVNSVRSTCAIAPATSAESTDLNAPDAA